MKLRIAEDLALPLELVTESVGILAVRRAGKSHTAKKLTEQLHRAGQQVVVVDPKGDWWGLRSSADGRGPGLPLVILGGEHGDVPLEPGAGELVAKLVVEQRVSLVIDLAELRKHQVATFMTAFLETVYRLKAKDQYRTPMMLVIDEADAIAPQRPMKGEERMLGAAEDIVRRGGQRGIGIVLVSQRAAVLNKNVLTQVGILVLLRTTGSQDIDAVDEWIRKHGQEERRAQVLASIASLPRGTGWVWAPGWPTEEGIFRQVQVSRCETFDSGATPKPGQQQVKPKTVADVDLEAFRREMANTIERAKAEDPKELRRLLAERDREIAKMRNSALSSRKDAPAVEKIIEKPIQVPMLSDEEFERLHSFAWDLAGHVKASSERLTAAVSELTERVLEARDAARKALNLTLTAKGKTVPAPRAMPISRPQRRSENRQTPQDAGDGVTPVMQRILDALAELEAIGASEPERELVAFMAHYTNLTSKGFANAIGALNTAGHTISRDGRVMLSDSGRRLASLAEAPRTPAEVQERVINLLGGTSARILRPLLEAYPNPLEKTAVAEAAGYTNLTSKGFANAIGRLRSLGFVDYPATGQVAASPVLFLEGARRG